MNIINIDLIETNDKQLICTSGNFVMGYKGDNNTTKVHFNVPEKFEQENAIAILITPDKTHQYSVPLSDFSFVVTTTISKEVGDWNVVLMLMGSEEENTPICVSSSIVGTIKDSGITIDDFETLPVDTNMEVLVNTLLSLQKQLEETLLNENIETVQQIQEDLNDIKNQMSQLFLIDWKAIEQLGDVGNDMIEIKTLVSESIETTRKHTTILNGLESDHTEILDELDAVDDKIGDNGETTLFGEIISVKNSVVSVEDKTKKTNQSVSNMQNAITNIDNNVVNMQGSITNISGEIVGVQGDLTTIKEDIETTKTNIDNVQNSVNDTQNTLNSVSEEVLMIKSLIGTINEELLNL